MVAIGNGGFMNNICSLLIDSCDIYSDGWDAFFTLLKKYWETCPYNIYLNTETKSFRCDEWNVNVINCSEKLTWSERLKNALNIIDTKYVLLMESDYLIEDKVNEKVIFDCINWMETNPNIAAFSFMPCDGGEGKNHDYYNFEKLSKKSKYRSNLQAGLWNRKILLKSLRNHECAWQFERWSSFRSKRTNNEYYSWISDNNYVIPYNWGKAASGGMWNIEEIDRLEQKTGIKFEIGSQKMKHDYEFNKNKKKKNLLSKELWGKIIPRIRSMV